MSKKAAAVDSYDVNKVIRTALDNNVEVCNLFLIYTYSFKLYC